MILIIADKNAYSSEDWLKQKPHILIFMDILEQKI